MATVIARYPITASARAQALGHLDRLGKGAEYLQETDDELLAVVHDYSGDAAQAEAHFAGAASVEHGALTTKRPAQAPQDSQDFPTEIEIDGVRYPLPASAREWPPVPPETTGGATSAPDEGGEPDTADKPSGHLSGAAQAQATRDKKAAAKK